MEVSTKCIKCENHVGGAVDRSNLHVSKNNRFYALFGCDKCGKNTSLFIKKESAEKII